MSDQGTNGKVRSTRQNTLRMVGTLISLALLIYLLSLQGWDEIWAATQSIPLWRFVLAILLMLASRLAISLRWYTLLHAAKLKISFWQSLKITFAGLFASNFLPTTIGGDFVRLGGAIRFQLDGTVSAASLIADRLVGMAGMAMALPFSIPAWVNLSPGSNGSTIILKLGITFLSTRWIQEMQRRVKKLLADLTHSLMLWLRNPAALLQSLACTWVNMICLFLILQILLGGIGEKMSFWTVGGLYSLVYFVTLVPISVNGFGLQEISMTLIFSNLGRASMSSGLTVALLFRTLMMLASLPGAVFLPDFLTAKQSKNEDHADQPPA